MTEQKYCTSKIEEWVIFTNLQLVSQQNTYQEPPVKIYLLR